ncbi:MAG: DUF3108 domain-containing protein [Candidatus Hatepunaea meridiana]|nr:DUF3108 domain-containing protein [Candidatus Hatepunaea meridiana]
MEDTTSTNFPFRVGEKLHFKVYLGVILGGYSTMSVQSISEIDGHPCYEIVSVAKSRPAVDTFYKVRDRIVSWRDVKGGFSRRYEKHLHEGGYRAKKVVEYKPEEGLAYLYEGSKEIPDTLAINGLVQDVFSAFYYLRSKDLKVGNSVWIDVHDIRKQYKLEVLVLRKERIKVPAGKFNCFVIEPKLMSSGIFRREGKMQIWISDDENRLPVIMRSKLYFGSVWAKLTGYSLGADPNE